jgi:hypothetical protein
MAGKTIRVLARGSAMVPDYGAASAIVHGQSHRFVGREWDESLGDGEHIAGGWRPLTEPTEIAQGPNRAAFAEIVLAIRAGDLWPADVATARLAGCEFDPHFGGEYAVKESA